MLRGGGRVLVYLLFAFFSGVFTLFVMAAVASSVVATSPVMTIVITSQLSFHSWHPASKKIMVLHGIIPELREFPLLLSF